MGQESLVYSFVARGTVVLVEYKAFPGNASEIAKQCLSKMPANDNKITYTSDKHTFNFLVEGGFGMFHLQPRSFGSRSLI